MEKSFGNQKKFYNSYLGMAENDYLFAANGLDACKQIDLYNSVASTAAQSAEKYLKAILNEKFIEDETVIKMLRSHNLRTIFNKVKEKYPDWEIDTIEVKWLGDFYFDARYPGDDFVYVNVEDAKSCLTILQKVRSKSYEILGFEKASFDVGLKGIDIFN